MSAYLKALPLAYGSTIVQGGFFPRAQLSITVTPLVAATDSAWLDTGIDRGFGILFIWSRDSQNTRMVLSDVAAGPSANEGPAIFFAPRDAALASFLIDPSRRFFRLIADSGHTVRWAVERVQ